ncbi:hypothetical protein [Micromonospora sp. NPDC004704]
MTGRHRPLSPWVARVGSDGLLGEINDGHEHCDARDLSWFTGIWGRTRITAARAGQAPQLVLALREQGSGDTVVELDNYGTPLQISEQGLAVIAEAESAWPDLADGPGWSALAGEPLQLRHLLLRRLVAEAVAPPDPALFHMLDWDQVEGLAGQITARLEGTVAETPSIELRHWYSPALPGLTAGLEQIDAGQRTGRSEILWRGVERLFTALRDGDVRRLPTGSRQAIVTLLAAVITAEPRYRFAAHNLTADLAGEPAAPSPSTGVLGPALQIAAAGHNHDHEEETTSAGADGFEVIVTRSALSQVHVTVEIVTAAGFAAFLTVLLHRDGRAQPDRRYVLALAADDGVLTGTLQLSMPREDFTISVDSLPVNAAALRFTEPDRLVDSIRASDYQTGQTWRAVAAGLPPDHAVREAVRRFEEQL